MAMKIPVALMTGIVPQRTRASSRQSPVKTYPSLKKKIVKKLEIEMKRQAEDLNFERAIKIRDKIKQLNG
jgi:excinuclease UvrABC helicase subunit UvrB